MNRRAVLSAALLLPALSWSCAPEKSDSPTVSQGAAKPAAVARNGAPAKPLVAAADGQPPADAQWTLRCLTLTGFGHIERARQMKDQLIKATGMPAWYVVHNDNASTLFYGYYRGVDRADAAEHARVEADRNKIVALTDSVGDRPFAGAMPVPLAAPDPAAPPAWNLVNVPMDRYWTLEIACYKDTPDRKQLAVDAVRAARQMGVDAYYYHGPTASSVCIGAWPRDAVREQDAAAAASSDPDQAIVVMNIRPPPELADSEAVKTGAIRVLAPNLDVADPTLAAAIKQYPDYALNGDELVSVREDPTTGKQVQVPRPTQLVAIPHQAASLLEQRRPTPPDGVPGLQRDQPADTGGLRSLGP